ncbi:MAG: Na(+)-translocating NADH-quinone reductase subunit A [Pseudomonadota bacterium]
MKLIKGLDLPITGEPVQAVNEGRPIDSVALNGLDYHGLKPRMLVAEGDTVRKGQPLFVHKDDPEIQYVAPGAGRVRAVNRGPRRVLETVVIDLDGTDAEETFEQVSPESLSSLARETVQETLYRSGFWTAFRTRPFSKVPSTGSVPRSIFVTAMDSEPLAPDAAVIIDRAVDDFAHGLEVLSRLTDGAVYVCHYPGADLPGRRATRSEFHEFDGPHPAGLPGTHIHFLDPVSSQKTVWSVGYQDVIAIGRLFTTGRIDVERVVGITGPLASNPRLVTTRVGASLYNLTEDEVKAGTPCRIISGTVTSGHHAHDQFAYLGRYHRQVTLMEEDHKQHGLGWLIPSKTKYSFINVHLSALFREVLKFPLGTNLNGSPRAMVPLGSYERVIPMDLLPTQLLRALLVLDTDSAQALGALELDEEDLALCTFVCHSKYEYGEALRASLEKIEKEG